MMTMRNTYKTYSELIKIEQFEDRIKYLKLSGTIGEVTFGGLRYLNQILYHTWKWKSTKKEVILRDNGYDLAHRDYPISGTIYVHHINPITIEDVLNDRPCVFDLDNLVSSSFQTHNAIHYGRDLQVPRGFVERKKNDTCPWK